MFFFRKPNPAFFREPDLTRVRLLKGWHYLPKEPVDPTHTVYTLLEWAEDSDGEFPDLAVDCALAILDDYPAVLNAQASIRSSFVAGVDAQFRLLKTGHLPFSSKYDGKLTLTAGADRELAYSFPHDDESEWMSFLGFRCPIEELTRGGDIPPYAISVGFYPLHYHLRIETAEDIKRPIERMREVCRRYGKTLVLEGFDPADC